MPVTRQSGLDQSDLLRTAPAVLLTIGLTALLTDSLGTTSHLSPDDARDQLGIVIITIITAVVSAVLAAVVGTSAGTAAVCATVLVSWGAGAHFLLDMNDDGRTAISCIAVAGMLWGLSMTCTADEAVIKGDRALISRRQAILRDPTILMAAFFLSSLAAGGVEATLALYDNDTYHHETIVVICFLGLAGARPARVGLRHSTRPGFLRLHLVHLGGAVLGARLHDSAGVPDGRDRSRPLHSPDDPSSRGQGRT